jgi:hypothetical protein
VIYIGIAATAFLTRRLALRFLTLRETLRANFLTLRFAFRTLRFADLRVAFRAAALRTVERRLAAFLFLFAVIGIETTPST